MIDTYSRRATVKSSAASPILGETLALTRTTSLVVLSCVSVGLFIGLGALMLALSDAPNGDTVTLSAQMNTAVGTMFLGVVGIVAVSGAHTQRAIAYSMLVHPRWRVFVHLTGAVLAVAGVVALASVFGLAGIVALSDPGAVASSLPSLAASWVAALLLTALGAGIAWSVRSTAGAVFLFLGVMWAVPLAGTTVDMFVEADMSFLTKFSPAILSDSLVGGGTGTLDALLPLLGWVVVFATLGWFRFRRFTP